MTILEQILEFFPEEEIMKADGHDDAIIGIDEKTMRLVYSRTKVIAGPIFVNDDWEDPVKQ